RRARGTLRRATRPWRHAPYALAGFRVGGYRALRVRVRLRSPRPRRLSARAGRARPTRGRVEVEVAQLPLHGGTDDYLVHVNIGRLLGRERNSSGDRIRRNREPGLRELGFDHANGCISPKRVEERKGGAGRP